MRLPVVVVEDVETFRERLKSTLRTLGYQVDCFGSVPDAQKELSSQTAPYLVLLDHDFGTTPPGYELAAWIRETHPLGLLLPIIYLTGRESPAGFLGRQRTRPHAHPSMYIGKDELARDPSMLVSILECAERQFQDARRLAEAQAAEQAILGLAGMDQEAVDGLD